jgi:hypothetical protein
MVNSGSDTSLLTISFAICFTNEKIDANALQNSIVPLFLVSFKADKISEDFICGVF